MADKQKPDTMSTAQDKQTEAMDLCRDVYGGTFTMRKNARKYLPQFPKEKPESYNARVNRAVLYNGMGRAVTAFTGMVMRKPLDLSLVTNAQVSEHLTNVDRAGRDVDTYAREAYTDMLVDGHRVILVDMPPPNAEARNAAEEGERTPYWVDVPKGSILRFSVERVNGVLVVTRFAYKYTMLVPEGDYGDEERTAVREFYRVALDDRPAVTFREWLKDPKKDHWDETTPPDNVLRITRDNPFPEIPLSVCYARRSRALVSEPPLLDLAHENVRHFQLRSDRDTSLHYGAHEILTISGAGDTTEIPHGPGFAIRLPSEGKAAYVGPSGAAYEASRDELRDTEQRMASMSLAMLQRDTRAAETAEARRIDKSESDSGLQSSVDGLEKGLNNALRLHFMWLGEEQGDQKIKVNRDFERMLLTPQQATELRNALNDNRITIETYWRALMEGEWLPDSFDPDDEAANLEQQEIAELERMRRPDDGGAVA